MNLTINGPRSQKLFGTNYNDTRYISIIKDIISFFTTNNCYEKVFIGMASGIDLLAGLAVINFNKTFKQNIKLICCIPGKNQTEKFTDKEKEIYDYILKNSNEIIQLSENVCSAKEFKERNQYMIDNSDELLSYWNGQKTHSGTYSAISYAYKKDKKITVVNPLNLNMRYDYRTC